MKTTKTIFILMAVCGLMSACDDWNSFKPNECNEEGEIKQFGNEYFKCVNNHYEKITLNNEDNCFNLDAYKYKQGQGGCIVMRCQNYKWETLGIKTNSCIINNGEFIGVGVCENGKNKCEEQNAKSDTPFEICVNGQWFKLGNKCGCDAGISSCTEVIKPYGMSCSKDTNGIYQSCTNKDGQYTSCHNDKCGECLNDTTKCIDVKSYQKCKNGNWDVNNPVTCSDDEICQVNTCIKNSNDCTSDDMCGEKKSCKAGKCVDKLECESSNECGDGKVCESGKCLTISICNGGEKQCGSDGIPQVCKNNQWHPLGECTNGQVCENGDCVNNGPECKNNNECNDGKVCVDGKCVECKDEEILCSGMQTRKYCKDGQWQEESCLEKICKDGNCVECEVGDKKCTESNKSQYLICGKNADWTIESCSENQACYNGDCIEECNSTDDFRCNGDSKIENCIDFNNPKENFRGWGYYKTCDNGEKCDAGQCKPTCSSENEGEHCGSQGEVAICHNGFCIKNGDKCDLNKENSEKTSYCQKDNITHIKCWNTGWDVSKCPDGNICLGGGGHVAGVCTKDEQCLQNEKCDAGQCKPTCSSENEGEQCGSQGVCHNELCIKEGDKCDDDTPFCNNNESYQCSDSTWKMIACSECNDGLCKTCIDCNNGACVDGKCYKSGSKCNPNDNPDEIEDQSYGKLKCIGDQWYKYIENADCGGKNTNDKNGNPCESRSGVCLSGYCVSTSANDYISTASTDASTRCFGDDLIGIKQSDSYDNYKIYACSDQHDMKVFTDRDDKCLNRKCREGKCIIECNEHPDAPLVSCSNEDNMILYDMIAYVYEVLLEKSVLAWCYQPK